MNGDAPPDLSALTERPGPGSHRTTIVIDGQSVEAGHYHQGPLGQRFWSRLVASRILPAGTPIETADDALMAAGHGITDLLKTPSPRDDATHAVLTAGVG